MRCRQSRMSGGPTAGTNPPRLQAILLPNLFFPFTICSSPFTPSHFPIPAPAPHAILPPSLLREPGPDRRSGRAAAASPSGSVPEACEGPRQAGALRNPLPTSLSGDGAQGAEKPREGFRAGRECPGAPRGSKALPLTGRRRDSGRRGALTAPHTNLTRHGQRAPLPDQMARR